MELNAIYHTSRDFNLLLISYLRFIPRSLLISLGEKPLSICTIRYDFWFKACR
jgi:hypothetical protein